MNAERRKAIRAIIATLEQARDDLDTYTTEEREYFDNMPESLQASERGQKAEETADVLQTAWDELDSLISNISDAIE